MPSSAFAIVYGALDEKDEAFAWLEKAYEERDPQLTYLKVGPRFDPCVRTRASEKYCDVSA